MFEPADPAKMAFALPSGPSIAVLPFDQPGADEQTAMLAQGLMRDSSGILTEFRDLTVISSESTLAYRGNTVPLRRISEDLGVHYLLSGTIERMGTDFRIRVRLLDTLSGRETGAEQYEATGGDLFRVRDQLAGQIGWVIGAKDRPITATALSKTKRTETQDLGAYQLLLPAQDLRHRFNAKDNAQSVELLEVAVALEPLYARAYADLARSHAHAYWNGWVDPPDAASHGHLGNADQAGAALGEILERKADLTPVNLAQQEEVFAKGVAPTSYVYLEQGLRKAGRPDG